MTLEGHMFRNLALEIYPNIFVSNQRRKGGNCLTIWGKCKE